MSFWSRLTRALDQIQTINERTAFIMTQVDDLTAAVHKPWKLWEEN